MKTVDNFLNKIPKRICQYLNERGLSDEILILNKISWNGTKIVIPVFDENSKFLFNKYRRDPMVLVGPKYYYDKGSKTSLYGIQYLKNSSIVIIVEGEFDSLILQSKGICAVTSTGGAGSFQESWKPLFEGKDVYVCLDNDKAGLQGKIKIFEMLPNAKNVPLPKSVKDVTDYFIKLNKTINDFKILMQVAEVPPRKIEEPKTTRKVGIKITEENVSDLRKAKKYPIENILKFNQSGFANCPLHIDKTASLHYRPNNKWHCFSCSQGGDSIDLIMKMNNVSMKEAINIILKK